MASTLKSGGRLGRQVGCAALAFALMLLACATSAQAAQFGVTDVGDQTDARLGDGVCDSNRSRPGAQCTLRAAVAEANAYPGADYVSSTGALTDVQTIHLSAPLVLTETVHIEGCGMSPDCWGIDGGNSSFDAFVIDPQSVPDNVEIDNLKLRNFRRGIYQPPALSSGARSDGLTVRGVRFDHVNKGVELHGNNNTVGNYAPDYANRFEDASGADSAAIELHGASNDVIANVIGLDANGEAAGAKFVDGIRVFGRHNRIGSELSNSALYSAECDGACNVIGNASDAGIDLDPIQDPDSTGDYTEIHNNFIGIGPTSNSPPIGNEVGLRIDRAEQVTVGEELAQVVGKGGNFIGGNRVGVSQRDRLGQQASDASNEIRRNVLGTDPWGRSAPNTETGIAADSFYVIDDNEIAGGGSSTSLGILLRKDGSKVASNSIGFEGAFDSDQYRVFHPSGLGVGLRILGDYNQVVRTQIGHSAGNGVEILGGDHNIFWEDSIGAQLYGWPPAGNGGAGILIGDYDGNPALSNLVSPYMPSRLGTSISNNAGAGIAVTGGSRGNRFEDCLWCDGNGGPLVDLGNDGPGNAPNGPNGGAQAPFITNAWAGSAGKLVQGTAPPGATVSTYAAGSNGGAIGTLFGRGGADAGGHFSFALDDSLAGYGVGGRVVATQTTEGGTSEVSPPRGILAGAPLFGQNQKPTKVPEPTRKSGGSKSKLVLTASALRLKGSTIRLPLECHAARSCKGKIAIRSAEAVAVRSTARRIVRKKVLRIGSTQFSLSPGARSVEAVDLTRSMKRLLRRLGSLQVKVFLTQPASDDAIYTVKLTTK